ncbi:hypothetical protein L2E82_16256 [Cichorium intybus]|uniref:Uncharacterized protein n=1 Tax=Cichorium intybus TaxID=13427 RepID=A0ACB9F529_CICIN|nr:hypothetical protein L2E82_16256 [Cichorium intybus]
MLHQTADCSSADLASTPSDYISGDCIFHSFSDFFLHQHLSLLGFDSQNGIPRRLFGKGGFDAGFKPCALAYNVLIQFWGGNGFQKFEKIKDPSRPSRQLEELTGKMRECKRLIKEFDREVKDLEHTISPDNSKILNEKIQSMV